MSARGRGAAAALLALLAAAGVYVARRPRTEAVAVPAPDTSAMEPEVAAKIAAARAQVLAEPSSAQAWGHLGMVLHAHKAEHDAGAAYEQALTLDPSPRWHYYLAKLQAAEKPAAALIHAQAAVKGAPSYVPARVVEAELLEQTGQPKAAIAELRQAEAQDPGAATVQFALGRLLLAEGDARGSADALERALARQPSLGSAQGLLARAYKRLGDDAAAQRHADLARQAPLGVPLDDPWMEEVDAEAVSLLGYLAQARRAEAARDLPRAEALYKHLAEIRPQDGDVRFVLGEMYLRYGRGADARAAYEDALRVQPNHPTAHLRLGQVAESLGDREGALAHYRAAVKASPEVALFHRALAEALGRAGDVSGAQAESAEADRLSGGEASAPAH